MCGETTVPTAPAGKATRALSQLVVSAPAALLLCGEYFVTEAGGRGLCLAVEPRATCTLTWHGNGGSGRAKSAVRLITRFGGQEVVFQSACEDDLYRHCENCSAPYMQMYEAQPVPEGTDVSITVDTQAFYGAGGEENAQGSKRGLGSSETAAVLMCAAIALINGKDIMSNRRALAAHAAHAHYAWQGGRGSGYGAWASVFGGLGLYTNRVLHDSVTPFIHNRWQSIPTQAYAPLHWWFWNCGGAQSSEGAMRHYGVWKEKNPQVAADFAMRYARFFSALEYGVLAKPLYRKSSDMRAAHIVSVLEKACAFGLWVGEEIGVSAKLEGVKNEKRRIFVYKAVGAGRECAVGVSFSESARPSVAQNLRVADGLCYDA